MIVDLRAEQVKRPGKHRIRNGAVVVRDPAKITSLTVHQTACVFGPANDIAARNRRALNVACHALTFRDGTTVLPNPLLWYVNQGNAFNPFSIGEEFEGHYAGREDDPSTTPRREDIQSTWGGKPMPLTPDVLDGFRLGMVTLVTLARDEGCPIEFVHAHRQSSDDRRSDPGEGIWKGVVLYLLGQLGLRTEPARVMRSSNRSNGDGKPIPREWDPSQTARY